MNAPIQEQFELLYERLQSLHGSGVDSMFKVAGFFLLVTGWVLTSDNAQALLVRDPLIRVSALVTLVFVAVAFAGIALRLVRESGTIFRRLKALGYMPVEHYEGLVVRSSTVLPFLLLDLVLTLAICVFVLRL